MRRVWGYSDGVDAVSAVDGVEVRRVYVEDGRVAAEVSVFGKPVYGGGYCGG